MSAPSGAGPALSRSLGLRQAAAMVAGTMLGAAIFVQASEIGRHLPSVAGVMGVWLVAGLVTFCGASVCAELASAFPRTGGVYIFLKESFSPALGFLWGWAMFWSIHSGIVAAIAVIFARYVAFFAPMSDRGVRAVAVAGILCLSAVNYIGVRQGSALQVWLTLAKVLAVACLLVLFFTLGSPAHASGAAGAVPAFTRWNAREFVLALSAALFAFGGWHMVTYTAGETRDPEKTIARALWIGTLIVTACYVALNAAYLRVLSLAQVVASTRVAADAANVLVGPPGAALISGLVIVSSFGALNGVVLTGPRVYFAMAQDGLLFRWMGAVHPRYQTPHRAILLQALWSSVLVATDTYRGLYTRVVYTEWLFFGLLAIGLFRLRQKPGYSPVCPLRGYPLVPLVFLAAAMAVAGNQMMSNAAGSALGLLLVVAGLPVYHLWARRKER